MKRIVTSNLLLHLLATTLAGTSSAFLSTSPSRRRAFMLPASHRRQERWLYTTWSSVNTFTGSVSRVGCSSIVVSLLPCPSSSRNSTSLSSSRQLPRRESDRWFDAALFRNNLPSTGTQRRQSFGFDQLKGDIDFTAADAFDLTEAAAPTKPFLVYCDLDGVLVDFAHGISQIFNEIDHTCEQIWTSQNIDALPRRYLWEKVQSADSFFENLQWCDGGRDLWAALTPLRPSILTGVPSYCDWAPRAEKFAWCQRELGSAFQLPVASSSGHIHDTQEPLTPTRFHHVDKAGRFRMHYSVNNSNPDEVSQSTTSGDDSNDWNCKVITCWSERKHHESGPGIVLIDDRVALREAWEAKGGIFIHHITGNVENTLQQLRYHGILPSTTTSYIRNNQPQSHMAQHKDILSGQNIDLQP